jgi:hypothetical protein
MKGLFYRHCQLAGFVPGSPISSPIPVHRIAECAEVAVDEKGLPIAAYYGLLRLIAANLP